MSPIYKDTYERLGEPPASDRHASRAETIEQANDGFNVELTFVVLVIFFTACVTLFDGLPRKLVSTAGRLLSTYLIPGLVREALDPIFLGPFLLCSLPQFLTAAAEGR